jgi:hypothetical protein
MERRKSRLLVSNVLALSLMLLLIAQSGAGIKSAQAGTDSWSIVTSPNPSSYNNYLFGVSLADSSNVWAVGSYLDSAYRTLVVKWNGSSWSQETSPHPYAADHELRGVHARTSSDVWAVGNTTTSFVRPLIYHRDASSWTSVSVPWTLGHSMYLRGVSAVSSNLAWAVGFDGSSPLIYKWNGTSWSVDTVPNITAQLRAVSALSSTDAWAVGSTGPGNTGNTVILHWNGTQWSQVTSLSPGTTNNGLSGVKAVSSNLAYAVGYQDSGSGAQTLALKWNGTSWGTDTSANPHTTDYLEAVDVGGTQSWAVGDSRTSPFRTLTERRNPITSTWDAVSSPNNNNNTHFLHGVAVDPDITGCQGGDIWAVGDYDSGSGFDTVIMQYTVTSPCSP